MADQLSPHAVLLARRQLGQAQLDVRVHVRYPGQRILHPSAIGVVHDTLLETLLTVQALRWPGRSLIDLTEDALGELQTLLLLLIGPLERPILAQSVLGGVLGLVVVPRRLYHAIARLDTVTVLEAATL